MSEEPIRIARRVLTCFIRIPRQHPDPKDVARLRKAAPHEMRDRDVDELACHIIEQEAEKRRAKHSVAMRTRATL